MRGDEEWGEGPCGDLASGLLGAAGGRNPQGGEGVLQLEVGAREKVGHGQYNEAFPLQLGPCLSAHFSIILGDLIWGKGSTASLLTGLLH